MTFAEFLEKNKDYYAKGAAMCAVVSQFEPLSVEDTTVLCIGIKALCDYADHIGAPVPTAELRPFLELFTKGPE